MSAVATLPTAATQARIHVTRHAPGRFDAVRWSAVATRRTAAKQERILASRHAPAWFDAVRSASSPSARRPPSRRAST